MGCAGSKPSAADYADAYLAPVPKPAQKQAPDLQPARPVFDNKHKKTLSAHIRDEAEQRYGINGPLGNSMSVRGNLKPATGPVGASTASAFTVGPVDTLGLGGADSTPRESQMQQSGWHQHAGAGQLRAQIPEDQAVQQDLWPSVEVEQPEPPPSSRASSFAQTAFSRGSLQSEGYFVPGRATKGSFHGSMQSRGRAARPSILEHPPFQPPASGSNAEREPQGMDMGSISTWVAAHPATAAATLQQLQQGAPQGARRELDARRDARKAQEAASVRAAYELDDLSAEWTAVLNQLDDLLFQAGKPGMDARDRAVAVRTLVESTAREPAENALQRALAVVERSRRKPA